MPDRDDWWGRLPGVVRALIAATTIFLAGMAAQLVVGSVKGLPAELKATQAENVKVHLEIDNRLDSLEAQRTLDAIRSSQQFTYVGCMLDALMDRATGDRCILVLSEEDRRVIRSLRRGAAGNGDS